MLAYGFPWAASIERILTPIGEPSRPPTPSAPLSGLTTHPAPAIVLYRANLGTQGGLDFLSVSVTPGPDRR
jgi:hypothetical protein